MSNDFNAACERMRANIAANESQDYESSPYCGELREWHAVDMRKIIGGIFDRTPITAESLAAMGVVRSVDGSGWVLGPKLCLFCRAGTWNAWATDKESHVSRLATCGQVRCLMLGMRDA